MTRKQIKTDHGAVEYVTASSDSTDKNPSVSVIIPVHGTGAYVGHCLRTVLDQDIDDFEVIVVDDASPDNAFEVVKEFAERDPRIRITRHEKKQGAGGARMTGVRLARGRYLAFVDSDDYVARDFLSCPLSLTLYVEPDIVEFGFSRVDINASQILQTYIPNRETHSISCPPAVWCKLWRKDFIHTNNLEMKRAIYYQDLDFTTRSRLFTNFIISVPKSTYFYRTRIDSTINSFSMKHILDYIIVFRSIRNFMVENGIYADRYEEFKELVSNHMNYAVHNATSAKKPVHKKAVKILRYILKTLLP